MKQLKILFATRHDALTRQGGDTVQMLKTKEFLEKDYNVRIELALNEKDFEQHKDSDIVHVFNLQTIDETLKYVELCGKYSKKVVLSTIYWDLSHSIFHTFLTNRFNLNNINKKRSLFKDSFFHFKNLIGKMANNSDQFGSKSYIERRRRVLELVDGLLPNSHEELAILEKEFGLNRLDEKTMVIPNAVDVKATGNESNSIHEIINLDKFVLEVGRIEPTKNQANVIKALENYPDIPIVFVGRVQNEKYNQFVRKLANKRGNVYFIDQINHDEIFNLYKKASVHLLPSFRESPGLSSLEALTSGCNIVVSSIEYCPVKYYQFDKFGEICDPYDPWSIEQAILRALNKERVNLPSEYLSEYSYSKAAELTFNAYEKVLGLSR
ncbi:glycosyltransferase family 4 protein [Neobacillus sp.]|uniref:glycosyltransferase family 4 protein n=1 Tax=Neobacillus sp. TaxID=2675273 RepID=UPI0028967531|nr:glycosyltransferase family 4 protein [Neobacillus sp.]